MSTAADRKAELELKKEKLRALREEKLRREELRRQGLSGTNSTPGSSADLRGEADALLKNLGIAPLKEPEIPEPKEPVAGNFTDGKRFGLIILY